jgi:Flp pilus assembly protein TadG
MAIVLPLLLFILFGLVDFGRMLNAQLTVTEAAREIARADAVGLSAAEVDTVAKDLSGIRYTVIKDCKAGATNAKVSAEYNFVFVTPVVVLAPLFGGGLSSPVKLHGTGEMTCMG